MILRRFASLSISLALAVNSAFAGDVLLFAPDELPDPQRIAEILAPHGHAAPPLRLRSLKLLDAPTTPTAAVDGEAGGSAHTSFALPVQFSFDSARILPSATAQLDAVAEGIKLAGPDAGVVIEGHTDAAGSHEYNIMLSLRRAMAVKRYLVRAHGIAAENLKVVGVGKSAPLNRANPNAPENRRVEFRPEAA